MEYLLLGPAASRKRAVGLTLVPRANEHLTVLEREGEFASSWKDATFIQHDLLDFPWPVESNFFDEVHAYEVLNLLGTGEEDFFAVWREIWRVLKPGGKIFATTPWWESKWVHCYPGTQRVYTEELFCYLKQAQTYPAQSIFPTLWPAPYNFEVELTSRASGGEGFLFILEKA